MKISSFIICFIIPICSALYSRGTVNNSYKGKCLDKRPDCVALKRSGMCAARPVIMRKVCQETCKFCSNKCFDTRKDCVYLRSLGYCKYHSQGMSRSCPKTCRFCDKNKPNKPTPKPTTAPKPTQRVTEKKPQPKLQYCKDNLISAQCQYYKRIGWCGRHNMKYYCRKTCVCEHKPKSPSCQSTPYGCCHDKKTIKLSQSGLGCPTCLDDPRYHTLCRRFRSDCHGKGGFAKSIRKYCFKTCELCCK
eukprot:gene6078-6781_t